MVRDHRVGWPAMIPSGDGRAVRGGMLRSPSGWTRERTIAGNCCFRRDWPSPQNSPSPPYCNASSSLPFRSRRLMRTFAGSPSVGNLSGEGVDHVSPRMRVTLPDGELEVHTGRVVAGQVAHRGVGSSRQRHRQHLRLSWGNIANLRPVIAADVIPLADPAGFIAF